MKIIHYIPSLDRSSGGTTVYIQLLGKALGQLVELHIVSHASDNVVEIPNCNIHFISSSLFGNMKKEWLELLSNIQPDIVHVNCCWMPQCAFTQKWAQAKGYKVVLTPHGMLEPWIMARNYWTRKLPALLLYQKEAVREADMLHSTADFEKVNLLKLGYNNKITVIPNGIETDTISLKTSWIPTKKILFLSRVHIKKGIELLIESIASLKEKMVGYTVIIAGEGDEAYIRQLKQKAEEMGISAIVQFVGGVYGEQKWQLFQKTDFFVLPTFCENFGYVVVEALACGTPVITTKGAPWQDLEESGSGWWIDISTDALINALEEALSKNEQDLMEMGQKGRLLVEQKYTINAVALSMYKLYMRMLNKESN